MAITDLGFTGNASDFLKIGVAAAGKGDLERVRAILEQRPHWLHWIGSHGRTMLWEAAYRGRLNVVRELAERGADIECPACHYTPHLIDITAHCAATRAKREPVAEYLAQRGAAYPVHSAAYLGDQPALIAMLDAEPTLLEAGAEEAVMLPSGSSADFARIAAPWATPLAYAVAGDQFETARTLIARGAEVASRGKRLLCFAAHRDNLEMFRLMLESGADAREAPKLVEPEWIALVEAHGGNPSSSAEEASQELIYTCRGDRGGNLDEIRRLLALGADINAQDKKGRTALHNASKAGLVEAVRFLLAEGADLERPNHDGETPLFAVLRSTIKDKSRRDAVVKILLEAGADASRANAEGRTAAEVARARRIQLSQT